MEDIIFTLLAHEKKHGKYISMAEFEELCTEHNTNNEELIQKGFVNVDWNGVRLTIKGKAVSA